MSGKDGDHKVPVAKTCGLATPEHAPGHSGLNQRESEETEATQVMADTETTRIHLSEFTIYGLHHTQGFSRAATGP